MDEAEEKKEKIANVCNLQSFLSLESLVSSLPTRHLKIFCGRWFSPPFPFFIEKSCAVNNTLYSALVFPEFPGLFVSSLLHVSAEH